MLAPVALALFAVAAQEVAPSDTTAPPDAPQTEPAPSVAPSSQPSPTASARPTSTPTSTTSVASRSRATRVFFSRIVAGEGASASEANIVADAILVAARGRKGFDVVGTTDLQGVLDVEATKAASGCDTVSCASEIADALDAPQLVTAQLGRVGRTWVLTLNRIDRSTLRVLAREQAQREGDAADAILRDIPDVVARLLPAPGDLGDNDELPLLAIGGVSAAAGVVSAIVGGAFVGVSLQVYEAGEAAWEQGDTATAHAKREEGEPLYYAGWIGVIGGGVLAVAGGALALVDVVSE